MSVIHSISTAASAATGSAATQPMAGPLPAATASPLGHRALASFVQRMAAIESAQAAIPASGFGASALTGDVPAAGQTPRPEAMKAEAGRGASGDEQVSEQWLLGMLAQHQAVIQTHEGAPQPAAPSATAEGETPAEALAMLLAAPSASAPLPTAESLEVADLQAFASAIVRSTTQPAAREPAPVALVTLTATPDAASTDSLLAALETPPAPAVEGTTPTQQPSGPTFERVLKLQAPEAKWGEQMLQALRDNVELQLQQRVQSATIRLDPPELGSLEILVSHESGRLSVQVNAAQPEVARMLQQTSERLRQELVGQHFVQVNVQVGADSGHGQPDRQPRAPAFAEDAPILANGTEHPESTAAQARHRDALVTV